MSKPRYTKVNIQVEESLLKRFREVFPQHGSLKWFINECFRKFYERYEVGADEAIRDSVAAALEGLKDG